MSSEELDDVKATIRALLVSDPKAYCTVNNLYHQYEEIVGEELPFKKFGCRSSHEFLTMIPDTVKILDPSNRNSALKPVLTEEIEHISKLVEEQNKKTKRNTTPGFRRPLARPYSSTNSHGFGYRPPPHFQNYFNHRRDDTRRAPPYFSTTARPSFRDDFKRDNYQNHFDNRRDNTRARPSSTPITLTDDFKKDVYKLLKDSPDGIDYEDFDRHVKRLSNEYDTDRVLDCITEFAFYNHGKVHLLSSNQANRGPKLNNNVEVIDLSSSGSIIEISDDDNESSNGVVSSSAPKSKMNDSRGKPSNDLIDHSAVDDDLSKELRSLFDELENKDGIWLTKLADVYRTKFSRSLSPQDYGFSSVMEMVKSLPSVFKMVQYRTNGDYLLSEAEEYHQSLQNNNIIGERRGDIPAILMERLRELVGHEKEIYDEDLQSAYERMYHQPLTPERYGFKNIDAFVRHLVEISEDIKPSIVDDRIVMKLSRPTERMSTLSGEVTYEYPNDVCDADFKLETDPIIEALREGDSFEVNLGETYSPGKFYITHIQRSQPLVHMMANLNNFYSKNEALYEVLVPLVTRNLLCACLYSLNDEWHRVRVVSVSPTLKTAKVFFVDYGTMENVDIRKLRYLHKDFASYPPFSVCAKLSGIRPKQGDTYDLPVNRHFFEFCGPCDLEVKIVRVYAACLEVLLFTLTSEGKKSVQEELISQHLVAWKNDGPFSAFRVATESRLSSAKAEKSADQNGLEPNDDDDVVPEAPNKNTLEYFNKVMADHRLKEKLRSKVEKSDALQTQQSNGLLEKTIELERIETQEKPKPPPGFMPLSYQVGQFQGAPLMFPSHVAGATPFAANVPFQPSAHYHWPAYPPMTYGSLYQNPPPTTSVPHYPYSTSFGTTLNSFHIPSGIVTPPTTLASNIPPPPPSTVSLDANYGAAKSTWYPPSSDTPTLSAETISKSVPSESVRNVVEAYLHSMKNARGSVASGGAVVEPANSKPRESKVEMSRLLQRDMDDYFTSSEVYADEAIPKNEQISSEVPTLYKEVNNDTFVDEFAEVSILLNEEMGDERSRKTSSVMSDSERSRASTTPTMTATRSNFLNIRDFVRKQSKKE